MNEFLLFLTTILVSITLVWHGVQVGYKSQPGPVPKTINYEVTK